MNWTNTAEWNDVGHVCNDSYSHWGLFAQSNGIHALLSTPVNSVSCDSCHRAIAGPFAFLIDRNANCQENRVDESTSNKLTLFNHTILQDTTINDQNYDVVTKSLFLLSVNFKNLTPF